MMVHQVYAQICNETVQNVIVCDNYELANRLARACYGADAFSVDCLQYPCSPGDAYRDGIFYHKNEDGTEAVIEYVPTQEQQVQRLEGQREADQAEITALQLALTEQYEVNLALEEEVTNTQMALTEIYEGMGV